MAPRASQARPSDHVPYAQRVRIHAAIVDAVGEFGYGTFVVRHVVERAGVSRRTFYDLYANKDEALLTAHAEALAGLESAVGRACPRPAPWPRRVIAAVAAALAYASANPAAALLVAAEPMIAGPHAGRCQDELFARFAPPLRAGRNHAARELPSTLEQLIVGGFACVIARRLRAGAAGDLSTLAAPLAEFALTPYLGPAAAASASGDRFEAVGGR